MKPILLIAVFLVMAFPVHAEELEARLTLGDTITLLVEELNLAFTFSDEAKAQKALIFIEKRIAMINEELAKTEPNMKRVNALEQNLVKRQNYAQEKGKTPEAQQRLEAAKARADTARQNAATRRASR